MEDQNLISLAYTAGKIAYAILGLLIIYLVVKLTLRLIRKFFKHEISVFEFTQVQIFGRHFNLDLDLVALVGIYAVFHLWNVLKLPTGL